MLKIPNKVTVLVAKTSLKAAKYAPQILFGAGVVGFGTTVVLASKATLELPDTLSHAEDILNKLNNLVPDEEYTAEDIVKAKALHRVKTFLKIGRLYLPALVVGSLSVAALTGSHRLLTARNASLGAAYTALDKGFREYRSRVIEEIGEEKEAHIRYGATQEKVVEVDETGKKTVVSKTVAGEHYSEHARLFEETNANWQDRPELNLLFLRGIQTMLNDRLNAKGFVTLNEAYRDLGLPETSDGAKFGWVRNGVTEGAQGVIDFGLYKLYNDDLRFHDYLLTKDNAVWLDFNIDGYIIDLIDKI